MCAIEKQDATPKKLLFINGTNEGEYDDEIPSTYFQTPPVQLGSADKGLEALRVGDMPPTPCPY